MFFNRDNNSSNNQQPSMNLMTTLGVLALWCCNVFCILGVVINMIIALAFGSLSHMYRNFSFFYLAGVIVAALSMLGIAAISLFFKFTGSTHPQVKRAIRGGVVSIAITFFLLILCIFF